MADRKFSSIDQFELFLFAKIKAWTPERRTAFSAAMAERWLHVYARFTEVEDWGDPDFMRTSLDAVWGHLLGNKLSRQDVSRYMTQLEDITPHMDFTNDYAALATAFIVQEAVECCKSEDNSAAATQAVLSCFEAVVPNWEMALEEQPRLWNQIKVQREMETQIKVIDEIEAISQFNEAAVQALRARMQTKEYRGEVMPLEQPAPGRATITNQDAFERYHGVIEVDLRDGPRQHWEEEHAAGSYMWAIYLFSDWSGRYGRRKQFITGEYGMLADQTAVQALIAKNQAQDAAAPGVPDWGTELSEMMEMALKNNPHVQDFRSYDEPHKYGPSMRRLWLEAEQTGLDPTQHILNWVRRRSPAWEHDKARKQKGKAYVNPVLGKLLGQLLDWNTTGDVEHPWAAEVDGENWQIRLNDFPEEPMYSLIIDGEERGSFHDWPENWGR